MLCNVLSPDASKNNTNFNSIDFESLLPGNPEECPHGEGTTPPVLLAATPLPRMRHICRSLTTCPDPPCPALFHFGVLTGNVEGEYDWHSAWPNSTTMRSCLQAVDCMVNRRSTQLGRKYSTTQHSAAAGRASDS